MRAVPYWSRDHRAAEFPSMEGFKSQLDEILGLTHSWLYFTQGAGPGLPEVPSSLD